jgi:hypothetical protein
MAALLRLFAAAIVCAGVGLLLSLGIAAAVAVATKHARAHEWYPPQCCSGNDCRPIRQDDVELRPDGFFVKESGELIPYGDVRIRKTPPEGGASFHRCSVGGKAEGATLCLYIPNWTG